MKCHNTKGTLKTVLMKKNISGNRHEARHIYNPSTW